MPRAAVQEVAHVAAGTRWFHWCCARDGIEPRNTFIDLLRTHMGASPRGPFNRPARLAAGFDEAEMDHLTMLAATG